MIVIVLQLYTTFTYQTDKKVSQWQHLLDKTLTLFKDFPTVLDMKPLFKSPTGIEINNMYDAHVVFRYQKANCFNKPWPEEIKIPLGGIYIYKELILSKNEFYISIVAGEK